MNDHEQRLRAWIRDFGDQKQAQFITDLEAVLREIERLREKKIMRQSQVYHAMKLVDRMNGEATCDETFMADVDRAIARANRLGPPKAEQAGGE